MGRGHGRQRTRHAAAQSPYGEAPLMLVGGSDSGRVVFAASGLVWSWSGLVLGVAAAVRRRWGMLHVEIASPRGISDWETTMCRLQRQSRSTDLANLAASRLGQQGNLPHGHYSPCPRDMDMSTDQNTPDGSTGRKQTRLPGTETDADPLRLRSTRGI